MNDEEFKHDQINRSTDWSTIKRGTPIWVKDSEESDWQINRFAKYENNTVYAYLFFDCPAAGFIPFKYAKLIKRPD